MRRERALVGPVPVMLTSAALSADAASLATVRERGTFSLCALFFFQAEDGIRDLTVTGVQTCALPISPVRWDTLSLDRLFALVAPSSRSAKDGFFCKAVPLLGGFPDYLSDSLKGSFPPEDAVIGLQLVHKEKRFFYAPSIPGLGEDWQRSVDESDLALLDGTFWTDDELIQAKRSRRTARDMGHLPLSGERGMLKRTFRLGKTKRVIIHINNTNPVLNEESPEHRAVREAGWEIAYDGDRKSTRLNSSHSQISYAVFCLKKKKKINIDTKHSDKI